MKVVDAEPHILTAAGDSVRVVCRIELCGTGVQHGANILLAREDSNTLRLGG
jgi:hypothetical protein